MNDEEKINVLMIYYDHWGKDEIRARGAVNGLRKTLDLLANWFPTEEEEPMVDKLRRLFRFNDDLIDLWNEFSEVLLGEAMFFDTEEEADFQEEDVLFSKKVLLEDHLNIVNEDTADLIYDDEFSHQNVLNVDAIVALL